MITSRTFAAAALGALLLGGCAYPAGSRDYRSYETRGEQSVRFGVVESVREVRIDSPESGVGTVGGGSGQVAGAIGGMILGGLIGQSVERSANERPGVELTVLLDSGRYIAVVQGADESFRAGDRVRILSGRGATRVTH
jgi:outer membrane lipoprotein SlyB